MLTVIGAGLPRTGTTTLKSALTHLLEGPCHHMSEVFNNYKTDVPAFTAAAEGYKSHWDTIYTKYRAAVDWPTAVFWKELSDHYPNALVILSVRDNPHDWVKSLQNTILDAHNKHINPEFNRLFDALWAKGMNVDSDDPTALAEGYLQHCENVRATIPAHRLLEWNAKEGWEPLCRALNLPQPNKEFPHLNTTADFNRDYDKVNSSSEEQLGLLKFKGDRSN